jgi:choline dehydrogenase-like flavoprotein
VVGSGAAGGIAACTLAEAGFDVVVVEEGTVIDRTLSARSAGDTLTRWFREGGTQVAEGRSIMPVLQGRCLGGGTAINSAICWRLPEDAYEHAFGAVRALVPLAALEAGFDEIEADLSIHPVDERVLGRNNTLLREGSQRLGWAGHVIRRNEEGCIGSANCIQACPAGRKRSADLTYLPRARARGARILTGWEVVRVSPRGGGQPPRLLAKATPDGGQRGMLAVEARRGVLLAASTIQTPLILRKSGLGNEHVGRHFRGHPGCAVIGMFDDPVRMWEGATQGYEVDEFRRQRMFKIETISMPPELGVARLPGVGMKLMDELTRWGYAANWAAEVRAEAEGTVTSRPLFGGAKIRYTLTPRDMETVRRGARALCELMFAAGAREVIPAIYGLPERLTSVDQIALIDQAPLEPRAWTMIVAHLFGTCRLHPDPRLGAVGERFEVHGAPGIHAIDSSIFPSNIGVNPQETIMSLALHAARTIAAAQG